MGEELEEVTHKVYFDVEVGGKPIGMFLVNQQKPKTQYIFSPCLCAFSLNKVCFMILPFPGRIIIGLFGKTVPKTVGMMML